MMKRSAPRLVLLAMATLAILASSAFAQKMCIDPGHGGSDPGAVGCSLQEKAVNLDVGNKLRAWYIAANNDPSGGGSSWNAIRTRSTDVYVSLSGRCTYANNNSANRFLSTHSNAWSNSSANGIETFSSPSGSSTSHDLRNKVYEEAVAMWPLTRRGTKTYNFYVLNYTNMPAELHEMGFITHCSGDATYLGSASHRDNQALSQLYASQRHYGIAKHKPQSGGFTITVDNTSAGFSASANWWTGSFGSPYGSNYHVRGAEAVSDQARWNYSCPSSGSTTVRAWWTDGSNRAPNASYSITRNGGSSTVAVNQQVNGGQWNTLGTFTINVGSNDVYLSCWTTSGYYVIADAVRIQR